ncbi:MAG: dihydrodipicolinate synthase family protein [Clostridia bacterium]
MNATFMTPCVTAFHEDGSLDFKAQAAVFDHLIQGGVDGVLVAGSMGEFFSLTLAQRYDLAEFSVSYIAGRIKVLLGTTSMNFEETVSLSQHALSIGADAVAVISPYYFKLTAADLERFYDELANRVAGSIYLYNYPERTNHDLTPVSALKLRQRHKNIIGIKDSAGSAEHTLRFVRAIKPVFPDFEVYCGFDSYFPDIVRGGGDGAIGGLSNAFPQLARKWVQAFHENNGTHVDDVSNQIEKLMPIYNVGVPFVPYIKEMMRLCGVPLTTCSSFPCPIPTMDECDQVRKLLYNAGF